MAGRFWVWAGFLWSCCVSKTQVVGVSFSCTPRDTVPNTKLYVFLEGPSCEISPAGKGRESSSTDPQGTMCPSSKAGCLQFGNSWLLCCQILLCNCLVLLISNTLFEVLCLKSPLNERIAFTALIVVVCCIPLSSVYVVFSP